MIQHEPLRQRFPFYLRGFGIGAAAGLTVGLLIFLFSSTGLYRSVGYGFLGLGTLMLLVGGGKGGGYANLGLGAMGTLARGYRDRGHGRGGPDDPAIVRAVAEGEEDYGVTPYAAGDPMERLRRGLRPPPNPTAFWQVIAGIAYLAVGVALTTWL